VAINTVGPVKSRILSFGKGGISGAKIRSRGVWCVKEIKKVIQDEIPLIAMGGIGTARDVKLYQKAGANFYGVGSSLAGMDFRRVKEYFKALERDLRERTNRAEKLLVKKKFIDYRNFKITKIKSLSNDLKIYYFDKPLKCEPGQFVFLNFEKREKPFSVASDKPLVLAVRKVGEFTSKIFRLKVGNQILIRGPYGKPFPIFENKENYLVCGGTGTAPLYFLAQKLSMRKARLRPSGFGNANEHIPITIFLGGKTKKELLFKDNFKKLGKLIVATEDGSEGAKGKVTEILEKHLRGNKPKDVVFFNCGPELMLKKAMELEKKYTQPEKIFSLTERFMKCGFGLCGHCSLNGFLTCVDGPYFDYSTLKKCRHFGKFKRDKTGRLVRIK
jgi:dihydroorotate dehydrogenase (NAD+) catalytic subunit